MQYRRAYTNRSILPAQCDLPTLNLMSFLIVLKGEYPFTSNNNINNCNGINNINNSPIAEASKIKTTTTTTTRSSATATTTNQSRGTTAKPVTPSSTTAPEKKAAGLRTTRIASSTSTTIKTTAQSGSSTFSETRNTRSKIGSTDSMKHQPGAAKVGCTFIIHSLQTGVSLQPIKIANLMMLLKIVVTCLNFVSSVLTIKC